MRRGWFLCLVVLMVALAGVVWAEEETATEVSVAQDAVAESQVEAQAPALCQEPAPEAALVADFEQILKTAAGQACGGATCGPFEYCCNPTCSLCLPYGMSCKQVAC